MTICQHEKCKALATHSVLTRLPLTGWPAEIGTVNLYLGIEACFEHALDLAGEGVDFPEDSKKRIIESVVSQQRPAPDFKRATFDVVALDSPGYVEYKKLSASAN